MSLSPQSNFLLNALPLLLHDHDCLVIPGMGWIRGASGSGAVR